MGQSRRCRTLRVSREAGLSRAHTGNPRALALQGAPCGHFPELLQEEAMYFNLSPIKDIYSIMFYEECTH